MGSPSHPHPDPLPPMAGEGGRKWEREEVEGDRPKSDPQRLGHQAVEVVHRMLADLAALGIDDEAALAVAARGEPALHGFADPVVLDAEDVAGIAACAILLL